MNMSSSTIFSQYITITKQIVFAEYDNTLGRKRSHSSCISSRVIFSGKLLYARILIRSPFVAQIRQVLLELGFRYFGWNNDVRRRPALALRAGVEHIPSRFVSGCDDCPTVQIELKQRHEIGPLINCSSCSCIDPLATITNLPDSLPFRPTAAVVGIRKRFHGTDS